MKCVAMVLLTTLLTSTAFAAPKCRITEYGNSNELGYGANRVLSNQLISLAEESDTLTNLKIQNFGISAEANHYGRNIQVVVYKNGKRLTKSFSRGTELSVVVSSGQQAANSDSSGDDSFISIECF